MFYNPVSKHKYAPYNMQTLASATANNGWTSSEFAGFHQWIKAGRIVRKGEKGTPVVFFVDKKTINKRTGEEEIIKVRKVKFVFNVEQTEYRRPKAAEGLGLKTLFNQTTH